MRSEIFLVIERYVIDKVMMANFTTTEAIQRLVTAFYLKHGNIRWKSYTHSKYYYVYEIDTLFLDERPDLNHIKITRYDDNNITVLIHATVIYYFQQFYACIPNRKMGIMSSNLMFLYLSYLN